MYKGSGRAKIGQGYQAGGDIGDFANRHSTILLHRA
jgi:hypothetical protein